MRSAALALAVIFASPVAVAGAARLQQAIASCRASAVEERLRAGEDPNATDSRGKPLLTWFASGRCTDTDALATLHALEKAGADFKPAFAQNSPDFLSNVAHRRLPDTLSALAHEAGAPAATKALKAIARDGDLPSVRALLSAGADPLAGPALTSALFDAAAEGRTDTVRELLSHVRDKTDPKVGAARDVAENTAASRAFRDAGIKPREVVASRNPCPHNELTGEQARLLAKLGIGAGLRCKQVEESGDLLLVDCDSAADGPAYYIDRKNSRVAATCGGACMRGCTGCPPPGWAGKCSY